MFPCRVSDQSACVAFHRPYLCLYSENQIDVFNVTNAEWAQTINLKRARPLHENGLLSICMVADMPYLVLLSSITQRKCFSFNIS
jgi:serine/threonine-protein kinase MRCK